MTRLLLALALVLTTSQVFAARQWIIDFTLEPRQLEAVKGPGGTTWVYPGDGISAHAQTIWFNTGFSPAYWVRAIVIWNPRGATNNGVRLIHADDGPSNVTPLCELTGFTNTTPIVSSCVITDDWNALVTGLDEKHILWQTKGNPYIMKISIEVVEY